MVQAQFAGGSDVHCRTLANRLHAAEHFNRISVVVAVAVRVRTVNRSHRPVFCFGLCDGSINLFGGHSAPRKCPEFIVSSALEFGWKFRSDLTALKSHEPTS